MKKQYLAHYIRLFLVQYLPNERGFSENTILAYRDALKLLMQYCDEHLKLKIDTLLCDQIDTEIIRNFLDYLENDRNCSPNTRNVRLAALKTFFYYLGREVPEYIKNSQQICAISPKKVAHKSVEYLDTDELDAILNSVDVKSRNGLRDKALLLCMHNTGARVQEVVDIKLDDLRLDAASQVKITGKGNKERMCPLWPETIKAIKAYLAVRKPRQKDEPHLFLNDKGEKITRFGIRHIIKKYTDKAIKKQPSLKQKKVSPHTFRHTTAMHLLQAGNDLNVVKLWLGHADLNTAHMYVDINMDMKKEILAKAQPPELKQETPKWRNPQILDWLDNLCEGVSLCEVKSNKHFKYRG
jgi:site-specific recombinase XerD